MTPHADQMWLCEPVLASVVYRSKTLNTQYNIIFKNNKTKLKKMRFAHLNKTKQSKKHITHRCCTVKPILYEVSTFNSLGELWLWLLYCHKIVLSVYFMFCDIIYLKMIISIWGQITGHI